MFENCFPNTLDTTVFPGDLSGKPDTYVISGYIDAMGLPDPSAQVLTIGVASVNADHEHEVAFFDR